ncbi:cyclic-di-AMP receptor [Alkalicoccus chagannorensis]|uniref:cyclic-di-AMP receptor n=1 Tax=Alkalicoccus chagannorensis TaxID=427072 RepID=UPI0003FE2CFB|nr:cyclic-di-AMP receptor [Alkalicoccus chagannorensis]
MKLMICIVQRRYREAMEEGLTSAGYRMTELASSGGFLKRGSTTFLIGIDPEDAEALRGQMQQICLEHEKKKGLTGEGGHRYTSFMIDAKDSIPFIG